MKLKRYLAIIIVATLMVSWLIPATVQVHAAEIKETAEIKELKAAVEAAAENLSSEQRAFIDANIDYAIVIGDEIEGMYGSKPPTTGPLSQSAYETGWGTSRICRIYHNYFGIGGASNPMYFKSAYASWIYYYNLVSTREGYVVNGSLQATNTYEYISALVAGGYCSDYGYLRDILSIANKIKPYVVAKEALIRAEQASVYEAGATEEAGVTEGAETTSEADIREKLIRQIGSLARERRVPK